MVGRIFGALNREVRGLHEAAYLLGLFALFSQVLALIRDRLLAESFGAGTTLDVYFAAFRIPDLIFAGVASFVSVYVLIPFLADRLEKSTAEAKEFLSQTFTFFTAILLLVSGAAFLLAPFLIPLLFGGFAPDAQEQLILLTRIMLIQPILLGLSSLFGSVTQTYRMFVLFALAPLLYNLGIIIGILAFYPVLGLPGLAWGVVLGAALHAGIQLPFLFARRLLPHFTVSISFATMRRIMTLSLPRTIGLVALQGVLLVLVALAARMESGSVAVFNLAFNLQFVPISIIGVSYSVAAFPTLARLASSGKMDAFAAQILSAARHVIFWSLPVIALFIVLRAQIVRVILGAGAFDWQDTRLTAAAVALFIISLAAHSLMLLLVRSYYAAGETFKPVAINVTASVLAVVFAFGFSKLFAVSEGWRFFVESLLRVEGIAGTQVLMLPLGYSLALLLNATVLLVVFQRDFTQFTRRLMRTVWQSFTAAVVIGFVAHEMLDVFDDIFDIQTLVGIFFQGFLSGLIGITAGILVLRLMGSTELAETITSLSRRIFRAKAVAPDQLEG